MKQHTLQLLSGKTRRLIAEFRRLAKQPKTRTTACAQLLATANYFARNLPFMDYPTYLAHGWPFASGVIEGACRHLVKDRCEVSGMRWSQCGAESLLRLRAVAENNAICDCMARSRSYSNLLKCNPLPLNLLHNRCLPNPPLLIQACLWLFELLSGVNSNETHPFEMNT